MHAVSSLAEPDYTMSRTSNIILDETRGFRYTRAAQPQLLVRSREIVFICIAYIPPRQSPPPSLPHPCQSVAGLKDSQLNLSGEIVAAYLVGNG